MSNDPLKVVPVDPFADPLSTSEDKDAREDRARLQNLTFRYVHERGQRSSGVLSYALSTNVDSKTEAHVQPARLRRLTDVNLLRKLMDRAPGGTLNIRTLAEATGISKSRIGYLLSGEKPVTTAEKADLIAQAVGTHAGAFFSDE